MSLASGKDTNYDSDCLDGVLMLLDKLTGGEEHVDRQRPAVNPEPRYLAEQKHKAMLEKAALEKAGGALAAADVGKEVKRKPVTFTFEGGSDDSGNQVGHCALFCVVGTGGRRSHSCYPLYTDVFPIFSRFAFISSGTGLPSQDHGSSVGVQDDRCSNIHS